MQQHFIGCCLLWMLPAVGWATDASGTCTDPDLSDPSSGSRIEMLLKFTNSCRYDRYKRPGNNTYDNPTVVSTHVHVYFLGPIQAQSLQFVAHLLVRFKWLDDRLAYNTSDVERVTSERQLKEAIWLPKIYLVNEQESITLGSPAQDVILSVQPDGIVTLITRVKVTLFCKMALAKFPFDQQTCPMVFETWTYNTSQLVLQWDWENGEAVTVNENLHLTEYRLLNMNPNFTMFSSALETVDQSTTGTQGSYFGKFEGEYSSLMVEFHLAREVGHYIMDFYVPSILLVVVSWVSFWLDPNAVPGRTTLGTSTMLTFITLTRNTGSSLPKVSYIKATEIWFIVCTAFIFGSLVEFAFVNTIWRRKQNVELKKVNSKYIFKSTLTPQMNRKQIHSNMDRCQSWPSIIDKDVDSPKDLKNYYISNTAEHAGTDARPPCLRKAAHGRKSPSAKNNLTVNSADSIQTDPYPSEGTIETHLSGADAASDIVIQVPAPGTAQTHSFTTMTPQEISQWIDERSRIVFPASFVLFNVLYWGFVWI